MAVEFFFNCNVCHIPTMHVLRRAWGTIPDPAIRDTVAREDQYLAFHRFLLDHLEWRSLSMPSVTGPLGWTTRAGAIKSGQLLTGSIAEGALLAHALHRGYRLPSSASSRTFGKVLNAWTQSGNPRSDVAPIWPELLRLLDLRNNVHLARAAVHPRASANQLLQDEQQLWTDANTVITRLRALT